jgi:hypothetical protein
MRSEMQDVDIGRRLKDELRNAQGEYNKSIHAFDKIVQDTPSDLVRPEGAFRVQRASTVSQQALEMYSRALKRYSDFILHDIIPTDL